MGVLDKPTSKVYTMMGSYVWIFGALVLPKILSQRVKLTGNCSQESLSEPLFISGVKRDALTCTLFKTYNCIHRAIPPHLEGPFMGSPDSLSVEPESGKSAAGSLNTPVVFTWRPPATAAGFHNFKGFYMEIQRLMGNSPQPMDYCLVFDFSQNNFTSQDHGLVFRKKILDLPGGSDFYYQLQVYTLPLQLASKPKTIYFTLPSIQDGGSTNTWSPSLSYDTDSLTAPANITVQFSLAPKEYHFKKYTVDLVSDLDEHNVLETCVIDTLDDYSCLGIDYQRVPEDARTVTHTFYNLVPATYKVSIEPVDPDSQNPDRCLCYERTSYNHTNCRLCRTTDTRNIVVKDDASPGQPLHSQHPTQITVTERAGSNGESTPDDTGTTLAAVFGSAFVFSLILFVIIVIICRRQQDAAWHQTNSHRTLSINLSSPRNGKCPLLVLPRKKVYLLYAEDHKDHLNVITSFAVYLKEQCYCEVFFLPWFKGAFQAIGTYQWIISHIDEADYVIVISSEAAFKLLDARNTNTSLRTEDEGPEGDIFSPAITHVRMKSLEPDFYRKTILVYFDYTSEDFVLKEVSPGVYYKLPKHFKSLLCHIHEVDVFDQTRRHSEIDTMENLRSNKSGQAFQKAIETARHFQKSNPHWFDRRFRRHDSAYRSQEDLEVGDSVSLKAQTVHVDPAIGVDDELKSTVTYNTAYALAHQGEIVPPSEVTADSQADTNTLLRNRGVQGGGTYIDHDAHVHDTLTELYSQDEFIPPSEIQTDVDVDKHFIAINMGTYTSQTRTKCKRKF